MQADITEVQLRNILENTVSIPGTFKQELVTSTARTLAEIGVDVTQSQLAGVRITVEALSIRVTDDPKATPTAAIGELREPGIYWFARNEAKDLKLIATAGDVTCQFQPQTFQS